MRVRLCAEFLCKFATQQLRLSGKVCFASAPMIMSLVYSAASVVLITIQIFGLRALALFTVADGPFTPCL